MGSRVSLLGSQSLTRRGMERSGFSKEARPVMKTFWNESDLPSEVMMLDRELGLRDTLHGEAKHRKGQEASPVL